MAEATAPLDFIRQIVQADLASGKHRQVVTRWPPEPNGYLHIGHAKAICLNFGIAEETGGRCNLRFDDTNPVSESAEFVKAQEEDLRWLGFDWGGRRYFASDYFEQLYQWACELIRRGRAFVCDLTPREIEARRGGLTEPGEESPYRGRSAEENLDLFQRMRAGEFEPGARVLRGKIDMASAVLTLRDPVFYRILNESHHRTGKQWPIYPLYDFAHCLSDAIEGITHSLCSAEFAGHRPLYEWILENLELPEPRPRQIEFSRLNLSHTVMQKRWLRRLVEEQRVRGWDDPRMPTLAGLRRRGYTPGAIRRFCAGVGATRRDNTIELARLEHEIRGELNRSAPRRMGVLNPLRLVIENYPEDATEEVALQNNPEDEAAGLRNAPFGRELWIERGDFMEEPPRKFFRMAPGREVRLRSAYLVTCTGFERGADGEIALVRCRYDPQSRGGQAADGRKVRGALHWVSARHAVPAEVRLTGPLFRDAEPLKAPDLSASLAEDSLRVLPRCWMEPELAQARPGERLQLERLGYFCVDADSRPGALVLVRTVTLRDTWAKIAARQAPRPR
ncbi:MAG: glutamine--tRNA ligase/YqeY domain fusion protein [Deltaproteobacteria bacterium]|nr:glutamine--tRNA ligase/YqeY domain fusion protein [Deltaproteobacteria bacterium]